MIVVALLIITSVNEVGSRLLRYGGLKFSKFAFLAKFGIDFLRISNVDFLSVDSMQGRVVKGLCKLERNLFQKFPEKCNHSCYIFLNFEYFCISDGLKTAAKRL